MTHDHHAELVERFGTPLYVYDLDEITLSREALLGSLPEGTALYYALKANPHPDVVRALAEGVRGCRAEVSSVGELDTALRAGVAPEDCLYTGPGKTAGELRHAISLGVRRFSCDSVTDVERVGAAARGHGVVADCLLRVNSVAASGVTGIRMTGRPSQFGFDSEDLPAAMPALRGAAGARVSGLHFFPLSNAEDEASLIGEFQHTVARAAELEAALGLSSDLIDIGGGFAAPYGVPGDRVGYPKLRTELEAALDTHLPAWRSGAPAIAFESGRYLTGRGGTLLLSVTNLKVGRGRAYAILDGGINLFGGMAGLGRLLPPSVRPQTGGADGAAGASVSLVGPLCTPGDVLAREAEVPELRPGDVITVPNAGAYGPTASLLAFLGRPAPFEVAVRGGEVVSATRLEYGRAPAPGTA